MSGDHPLLFGHVGCSSITLSYVSLMVARQFYSMRTTSTTDQPYLIILWLVLFSDLSPSVALQPLCHLLYILPFGFSTASSFLLRDGNQFYRGCPLLYVPIVNYFVDVVPVMIIQVMSKSDASIKWYNLIPYIPNKQHKLNKPAFVEEDGWLETASN